MTICNLKRTLSLIFLMTIFITITSCKSDNNHLPIVINSPDATITLTVGIKDSDLLYFVNYKDVMVIESSALKLELEKPIVNGFEVLQTSTERVNDEWFPVYGENSKIKDHYQSLAISLKEKGPLKRLIDVEFRVYEFTYK